MGVTLLLCPIVGDTTVEDAARAGDVVSSEDRDEVYAAYGASSRSELVAQVAAVGCRVCSVPVSLRPEWLPWPACPCPHEPLATVPATPAA